MIVAAWLALPGLPDRIPTHWGPDGRPDAWEDTSLGSLALGPLISLGTCAVMALTIPLVRMGAGQPTAAGAHGPAEPNPWRRFQTEGTARGTTVLVGVVMLLVSLLTVPTTLTVLGGGDGALPWWVMPLGATLVLGGTLLAMGPIVAWQQRAMRARAAEAGVRPTPEDEAEDARWTAAGLMKDPEDSRVMVPKRPGYGVGTTVNVGSRGGRALVVGFFALIAVALPAVLWIAAFSAR
nr:DUF1648 domain-containing protein [Micrococcus flavus]